MTVDPMSDQEEGKIESWRRGIRETMGNIITLSTLPEPLDHALRYATIARPSSCWRSILTLQAGESIGCRRESSMLAACAVEFLHCATLVVDDLPCMDNSEQRRGAPALHRRFHEAIAIQSSLWLLGMFRTLTGRALKSSGLSGQSTSDESFLLAEEQQRLEDDLQKGQFLDIAVSRGMAESDAEIIARLKTGRLFSFAAMIPALLTPTGKVHATALARFGERIGIAYQALDDLEDASGASCEDMTKRTFVAQFGEAGAREIVLSCRDSALAELACLSESGLDTDPLRGLGIRILSRGNINPENRTDAGT
jgi:geranylgeranyl pyrophosphate synthase